MYPDKDILAEMRAGEIPQPPIGLPIVYYEHADLGRRPLAAVVGDNVGRGQIDVLYAPRAGGAVQRKTGVWYVLDPALKAASQEVRSNRGCWDYLPGTPKIDIRPRDAAQQSKPRAQNQ